MELCNSDEGKAIGCNMSLIFLLLVILFLSVTDLMRRLLEWHYKLNKSSDCKD
jgi:hypothetical protein